jgi:superfamily I DNA/RNA helicase
VGEEIVQKLLPRFHQIVHVFGEDQAESRRRKVAFWMGRGGLKICTIHSFKGWEIDNVILLWPPGTDMERVPISREHSLFYTALSRGLINLVVLNANRAYDRFFKEWDLLAAESDPTTSPDS